MLNLLVKLPVEVQKILEIFEADICLVGGAVRDLLLNKTTSDYDFCSLLTPKQVQEKLHQYHIKSLDINAKYGTIIALLGDYQLQITTARSEKNFAGRACEVSFDVGSYSQDASRRDFTINALYLDFSGKLLDFYNGQQHLIEQKIEFIGDAKERIIEDHLRILRFFRFNIYYSQNYQPKQLQICLDQAFLLSKISKPRIRDEMLKILHSTAYFHPIFSFLNHLAQFTGWQLQISVLQKIAKLKNIVNNLQLNTEILLALALLNADFVAKNTTWQNLCFTKSEKKLFHKLWQDYLFFMQESIEEKEFWLAYFTIFVDNLYMQNLLLFLFGNNYLSLADYQDFCQKIVVWQQKKLPVTASDLIKIDIKPHLIKKTLQTLAKIWIKHNFMLNKEDLLHHL